MYELSVRSSFAAAHRLREYGGKCEKLHGHNWVVEVRVSASRLDQLGLAIDFKELKALTKEVLQALDHKFLNELAPFREENPSSEIIARWIYQQMKRRLSSAPVSLKSVSVWENPQFCASYSE